MDELLSAGTTYLFPLIIAMVTGGAMTSVLGGFIAEVEFSENSAKRVIFPVAFFVLGALWCLAVFAVATLRM